MTQWRNVLSVTTLSAVVVLSGCSETKTFEPNAGIKPAPASTESEQLAVLSGEIAEHLKRFSANPVTVMNEHLEKKTVSGEPGPGLFAPSTVEDRTYVKIKDDFRKKMCLADGGTGENCEPGRAPIEYNDQVEQLIGSRRGVVKNLAEMERQGLLEAKLDSSPWSDSYWPIYQGILGARYADYNFPADKDWKKNRDYVREFPAQNLIERNSSSIDRLGPAEKYDLLVGDTGMSLTEAGWREGQHYYDAYSKVEFWMGICHGWAAAAYMLDRPENAVTVTAADGRTKITFYPSDIKGLATHLWANVQTRSLFIGGRCNEKNPAKDESNGRVKSQPCFDNNPGSWHMAVVSLLGKQKRTFVMDATYDYEVWNQPVYSYSYTYFNPITNQHARTLEEAKVALADHRDDKFAAYRSPNAKHLVGIVMDVTYVVETNPSQRRTDSEQYDAHKSVRYYYDLELDANGEIIGGEWYTNEHPDFLWTPAPGARALSLADDYLRGEWDGRSPFPREWTAAAARASRANQPLAAVVEKLIELSRTRR